ncbi:MAG TPA: TldD/PmbA family protein [Armatimonadota bacterium]|nr:TldD/PmbA family protein [Armatimonadota bacterium]
MREIVRSAVETAMNAGATYADARIVRRGEESVRVKNGHVEGVEQSTSTGIGVRVIADGAWGFAASSDLSADGIVAVAEVAARVARASARAHAGHIELSPLEGYQGKWHSGYKRDPFDVPLDEKTELLLDLDDLMKSSKKITVTEAQTNSFRTEKYFASSEGADIMQETVECGALLQATAVGNGEVQTRSFPSSLDGYYAQAGWEIMDLLKLEDGARQIGKEAVELLTAPECPANEDMTVILEGSQLALQVHESCGHPIELDRALGTELSLAGGSFLTPDNVGVQYGSDVVNIVADATVPAGLGTFAYDDEGVPAQRTEIVTDGIFNGYLTSRETAPVIGQSSQGSMRADGWQHTPLIRMTNINLEPGNWTLDEMIEDTNHGILLDNTKSWSIDDQRLNFQFSTEVGWLIEDGSITDMVRNPSYQGITPEFWRRCDAVANSDEWRMWGVINCGKGDPIQVMHVGHGTSRARFQNTRVGIR